MLGQRVHRAIVAVAGVAAGRFLLGDPFESNFRNLRSHNADIDETEQWRRKIDRGFGQGVEGGFVVALARLDDAAPLQRQLRALDEGKSSGVRLFDRITSIDDLLPAEQQKKLVVLAQIRALLGSNDLDALDAAERAEALRLEPPGDLRALRPADVPEALARPFIEADGTRGRILLAAPSSRFDQWNADATIDFASNVRAIAMPPDTHLGGAWFVFADVLDAVLSDGPRATLAAALGAALVVLLVLGRTRHALVTLACGASGTVLMLGAAALLGFKVNFLDFVALPITIGIGIEYSVNIAARMRELDARAALASTGSAVFLCSYTTIVGYGSLVLSQNLGIRSFGLAAMLGEITCLAVAIVLAPALLQLARPRAVSTA